MTRAERLRCPCFGCRLVASIALHPPLSMSALRRAVGRGDLSARGMYGSRHVREQLEEASLPRGGCVTGGGKAHSCSSADKPVLTLVATLRISNHVCGRAAEENDDGLQDGSTEQGEDGWHRQNGSTIPLACNSHAGADTERGYGPRRMEPCGHDAMQVARGYFAGRSNCRERNGHAFQRRQS